MLSKAKEIMSSPAISVTLDDTLEDVIKLFAKHKISGVPVINSDEELVGIITERDLVHFSSNTHIIPLLSTSGWISPHTEVDRIATSRKGSQLLSRTKVKSEMSRKVYTVTEDTPGEEIARIMKKRNVDRVPVVDSENHLKGIVTRTDIVVQLAGQ